MDEKTGFEKSGGNRGDKYVATYHKVIETLCDLNARLSEELDSGKVELSSAQITSINDIFDGFRMAGNTILPKVNAYGQQKEEEAKRASRYIDPQIVGDNLFKLKYPESQEYFEEERKNAFVIEPERILVAGEPVNKNVIRGTQAEVLDFILRYPEGVFNNSTVAQALTDEYFREYASRSVALSNVHKILERFVSYGILQKLEEKDENGFHQYALTNRMIIDERSKSSTETSEAAEARETQPEASDGGLLNVTHDEVKIGPSDVP